MSSVGRRLAAAVMLIGLLFGFPAAVGATITGGCSGEGHSTSTGANLTTDTEWHLKSTDVAGGSGTSPAKMKSANVGAYALGIALPIASGTSKDGETQGAVDGLSVSTYAILGARFTVAGSASGDGQCSGQITIILDDVNPLFTLLGGGGILLALVGLIVLLLLSRSGGGCAQRLLGGFFGALGGGGAALAGEQFGLLDPTQLIGLFILIGAAIVGFLIPGIFGGGGGDTPTPLPAPATPAPQAAQPTTPEDYGSTATDVFKAGDTSPGDATGGQVVGGVSSSGGATPAESSSGETYPGGGVGGGGPM
jgi:hypothetical protein